MSEPITIRVESRETMKSRANRRKREGGYLPGSISAKNGPSVSVLVEERALRLAMQSGGRNAIFRLDNGGGESVTAMVRNIQAAPVSRRPLHVDFQRVSLSEPVRADVAVAILGREALEHRRLLLTQQADTVSVRGLPQDIPEYIEVDVSGLNPGDSLSTEELRLPEGLSLATTGYRLVLSVSEAKAQETEETAPAPEASGAAPGGGEESPAV